MKRLYRPNVAGIIMSQDYPKSKDVWIGLRNDMKDVWQFPQGGIDRNEETKDAFLREMEEEIGTNNIEIIDVCPFWLKYDFPRHKNGKYVGQKQKYFLAKMKNNEEINIITKHPEFEDYKFIPINELSKHISAFKIPIYKKAIHYFKKQGHL